MKLGKKKNCRIGEIKVAIDEIKRIVDNPNLTEDDYLKGRIALNMAVIQALIGAEFQKPKKDGKEYRLKFNGKLPNRNELAEIVTMLNDFIGEVENPFLETLYALPETDAEAEGEVSAEDDDMEIVPEGELCESNVNHIPTVEKWDGKKLKNYIFGYDGKSALSRAMLTATDCIRLSAIGEEVRKKQNRNKMLIIGGVALLITGGVVAGVVIHNHNKKDDKDLDDMIDDIDDVDVDGDIDVDTDIDVDDDVPTVEVDVD